MKAPTISAVLSVFLTAAAAFAQGTSVDLGAMSQDTGLPVEVTAENLEVNQADGTATFTGGVVVTQGEMTLSAGEVLVIYAGGAQDGDQPSGAGRIRELRASGGVTLVNGAEAAEAREARYTIASGTVTMSGDVVLTQGPTAISGDSLTIDLQSGTGRMEGRVRTIFETGSN